VVVDLPDRHRQRVGGGPAADPQLRSSSPPSRCSTVVTNGHAWLGCRKALSSFGDAGDRAADGEEQRDADPDDPGPAGLHAQGHRGGHGEDDQARGPGG
jgi:hypothetical protein